MIPPEEKYFDRDLSWLSFNYRVLIEARDASLPLYERLKFLAIYSSNLDEFFKVRVAAIRSISNLKRKKREKLGIELDPDRLMEEILETVERHQEELGNIFREEILPGLETHQIRLLRNLPKDESQREFVDELFSREVLPSLHPVLLQKDKVLSFLRENALYLAVEMKDKEQTLKAGESPFNYAIVQIPTHYFPRFVMLPQVNDEHTIMFLDDVIRYHLDKLFPGYIVTGAYSIKLTRDADLQIEDEFSGNLVEKIRKSLSKRQVGLPSRFLYDEAMSKEMLKYLRETFQLNKQDIMPGGRYHNFSDFFVFPNPLSPQLERMLPATLRHEGLDTNRNIFTALEKRNYLLHFPYHSYDYVLRFLNQAATDPQVKEIKATQYRVASNSAIVAALIRAAQNGKKVSVFVEIKARFDEESNLRSAQEMEAAGVKITYSFPILKVHAKAALVLREEGGEMRGYAFMSTGNFNEKTARIYADHGFFTSDQELTRELNHVFGFLTDRSYSPPPFKLLLVAQFNLKERFKEFIDREIAHAKEGRKGYIIAKMNNLEHPEMIDKLYEASQAGVKVDLILRGICCLRPGIPGLSENITVTRIVDQYLEHARAFVFYNDGANDIYLASADWMIRNLERRVEIAFPIRFPDLKAEILHLLKIQLQDNVKAVHLNANLENIPVPLEPEAPRHRAQEESYLMIKENKLGKELGISNTEY